MGLVGKFQNPHTVECYAAIKKGIRMASRNTRSEEARRNTNMHTYKQQWEDKAKTNFKNTLSYSLSNIRCTSALAITEACPSSSSHTED